MIESKRKQQFFHHLNKELKKYFSQQEIDEIVDYYEELIDDRLERGESIEHILNSYQPKEIARAMIPQVVSKRDSHDQKTTSSLWLILLILFSSPILIPLGVVYLVVMIVAFSILLSGGIVMASGVIAFIGQIIRAIATQLIFADALLMVGIGLIAFAVCMSIGYYMVKWSSEVLKHLAIWFGKLVTRKKGNYESY